jgi:hypothetical protein
LNLGKEYADNIRKYLNRYYEEVVQNGKIYWRQIQNQLENWKT